MGLIKNLDFDKKGILGLWVQREIDSSYLCLVGFCIFSCFWGLFEFLVVLRGII